ncbi:hypothetical protein [Singapore grouper iridovirus]|nr:hypothetical protein [Singapore grouper iridovirus]
MTLLISIAFTLFSSLSVLSADCEGPRLVFADRDVITRLRNVDGEFTPPSILNGVQPHIAVTVGNYSFNEYDFLQETEISHFIPIPGYTIKTGGIWKSMYVSLGVDQNDYFKMCFTNLSHPLVCANPPVMNAIEKSLHTDTGFNFVNITIYEHDDTADMYAAIWVYDGPGIYRYGASPLRPIARDGITRLFTVLLSVRPDNMGDNRAYTFFTKNVNYKESDMYDRPVHSYILQVCMSDEGGHKNFYQQQWTTELTAKLYCGYKNGKTFSELVSVNFVESDYWKNVTIYALFRNEWGMSAVCAYSVDTINTAFTTAAFFTDSTTSPPRTCPKGKQNHGVLGKYINQQWELKHPIEPDARHPLFHSYYNYTHIVINQADNTIMYASTENGAIHKIVVGENGVAVIVVEFIPYNHTDIVLDMTLSPSGDFLYVKSETEIVEILVQDCSRYGETCEDCVLSRDPACGWDGVKCSRQGAVKSRTGDISGCKGAHEKTDEMPAVAVRVSSSLILHCERNSMMANYGWRTPLGFTDCESDAMDCLFYVDETEKKDAGNYTCVYEEGGFSKNQIHSVSVMDSCE